MCRSLRLLLLTAEWLGHSLEERRYLALLPSHLMALHTLPLHGVSREELPPGNKL